MNFIVRLKVLLSSLLLTACMSSTAVMGTGDAPDWVRSEPAMYQNSAYLSATGSAAKAEQAKARALSNLAKIFEVQIREVSTTRQDVQTRQAEGVETVEKSASIASTVNLKTDRMVQGARIAEQWQSSADLTHHALAVLDRQQAGRNIRGEMRRLDDETRYALDQQKKRNDVLLEISDLHKAKGLQQNRHTLQKTLKIIDTRGTGSPASWNLAELDEQLQQTLRSLQLQTEVKIDDIDGLQSILQGAVANAGFVVDQATTSAGSYVLRASMEAQDTIKQDNWYWLRASLKIELLAQDGVTVLGHKSWPLKVSGGSVSQLQPRMRDAADKKLKQELLSTILDFAS